METQVLGVKPWKPFKNSFPKITRREQPPYYIDFNFPASTGRRLRPEGSYHSLVLRLPSEGGYDLLSLPPLATLIRRILSNLWTCHTPKFAADNLCTLFTAKSALSLPHTLLYTQYSYMHRHRVCVNVIKCESSSISKYYHHQVCALIINM